jgi:hypothetical protein
MSRISSIFQPNYVDQDPHYIPIVLVYVCGSVKAREPGNTLCCTEYADGDTELTYIWRLYTSAKQSIVSQALDSPSAASK